MPSNVGAIIPLDGLVWIGCELRLARLGLPICLYSDVHLVCYGDSRAAEYAWYVLGAYLALVLADAGWAAASLRLRPPQAATHLDQKQVPCPLPAALSSLRHGQRLPHVAHGMRSSVIFFTCVSAASQPECDCRKSYLPLVMPGRVEELMR